MSELIKPMLNYNSAHFYERAVWIRDNLWGSIIEIGSSYGYMLKHLTAFGITNYGIDKFDYKSEKLDGETVDILDFLIVAKYDWCVSWNVLDTLTDNIEAVDICNKIKTFADNQLHIICMTDIDRYTPQGYYIQPYEYWKNLLPDALLVDYDTRKSYVPAIMDKLVFEPIPLSWGLMA